MAGKIPSRLALYRSYFLIGAVYAPHLVPNLSKPLPWVSLQQMLSSYARWGRQ